MSTLVLRPAPHFTASAVMEDDTVRTDLSLDSFRGQYLLLLFYPFDFSTVCPTELLALDGEMDAFLERKCRVLTISTDSVFSHLAWKRTPVEEGGIGPVSFPMVSDLTREISREYGVLFNGAVALRGTFLVDPEGVVRHASVNDMETGRSVAELLRILDAIRRFDITGRSCPANWESGSGKEKGKAPERGSPGPAGISKRVRTFDLTSG